MSPDIQPVVQLLAKHFIVVAALIVASLIVRRRSAAFRHSFWVIGFAWVLLLPALALRLPHLSVEREVPDFSTLGTKALRSLGEPLQHAQVPPAAHPVSGEVAPTGQDAKPNAVFTTPKLNAVPTPVKKFDWMLPIFGIYAIGVLFFLAKFLTSLVAIAKSKDSSEPASSEAILELESAARAAGLRRTPRLIVNATASVPMTFWMGRSVVVVPSNSVSRAVLLHECAHIRRGDWFAQVFARVLRTLFWFDPILLFAEHQMRAASEQAADDIVVSAGVEPVEYAEELYTIAALSSGPHFDAGLAIVGTSNLKDRIAQILRTGPRSIRIRARWVAINVLLGGVMVVPLAAIAYSQNAVPATDTGFISFGNGYWIRLLAITEQVGDKTRSWNLKGELLPQPVCLMAAADPVGSRTAGRQTYLVLATNIDDMTGMSLKRRDAKSLRVPNFTSSFSPQSNVDEHLCEVDVNLPESGTVDMILTTPTTGDWTTYASAQYDHRRMVSHLGPNTFPKILDENPKTSRYLGVPPSLSGQIQFQVLGDKPIFALTSESIEGSIFVSYPLMFFGDGGHARKCTLRARPEPKTFMLTDIPVRPRTDSVMKADPLPGVEFHDAIRNQFALPDGGMLNMLSVTDPGKTSWDPAGTPILRDKAVPSVGDHGWYSWESYDPETANDQDCFLQHQSELQERFLHLTVSEVKSKSNDYELVIFDAAGLRADRFFRTMVAADTESLVYCVPETAESPPQDFVVRLADVAHASRSRLPIAAAFSDFFYQKGEENFAARLRPSYDIAVTRSPLLKSMRQDLNHVIEVVFLDAKGRRIETISHTNQGALDTYKIARADPSKIKEVEVVSMPCTYIRFPNVAVNPLASARVASRGPQ